MTIRLKINVETFAAEVAADRARLMERFTPALEQMADFATRGLEMARGPAGRRQNEIKLALRSTGKRSKRRNRQLAIMSTSKPMEPTMIPPDLKDRVAIIEKRLAALEARARREDVERAKRQIEAGDFEEVDPRAAD